MSVLRWKITQNAVAQQNNGMHTNGMQKLLYLLRIVLVKNAFDILSIGLPL